MAEQPDISRERVGSIIHEDLDMRKLSTKWVPKCLNADQKRQRCQSSEQLLEFFRCDPNDFLSRLVTMYETWLYHYDPETKQQSMDWRNSGLPRPKKFPSAKIHWKSYRLYFLGSRRHPPLWLSSKGPNYQRGVLLISAGAIEGHFEGKTPREFHQGVLFLHENAPAHRALATQKKLAYVGFQCLDHHPILRIWPRRTTTSSLDWRNNWNVAIFRPTRKSLLPRRPVWTDNLLNFFEWLAKVRARLRIVLRFVGSMLNKSRVWSL